MQPNTQPQQLLIVLVTEAQHLTLTMNGLQLELSPPNLVLVGVAMLGAGFSTGCTSFGMGKPIIKSSHTHSWSSHSTLVAAIIFHMIWAVATAVFGLATTAFTDTVALVTVQVQY